MSKSNNQILEEIRLYGPALFEEIKRRVTEYATQPLDGNPDTHEQNKSRLKIEVDKLIASTQYDQKLSADKLWWHMWSKICIAGTRAEKAGNEIKSMEKYPLFKDFRNWNAKAYNFEKKEWKDFVHFWKNKYGKTNWLQKAKSDSSYKTELENHFVNSGQEVINLMTKSEASQYKGIQFSNLDSKMEKYLKCAEFLNNYEKNHSHINILEYIAQMPNVSAVDMDHTHKIFSNYVGHITAYHILMDLGFPTIKPDRVMVWLFYSLGWIESLKPGLNQKEVLDLYSNTTVTRETVDKALYFAKQLEGKIVSPIRQLDIWFVKYGQEKEAIFGITTNLEKKTPISEVFETIVKQQN